MPRTVVPRQLVCKGVVPLMFSWLLEGLEALADTRCRRPWLWCGSGGVRLIHHAARSAPPPPATPSSCGPACRRCRDPVGTRPHPPWQDLASGGHHLTVHAVLPFWVRQSTQHSVNVLPAQPGAGTHPELSLFVILGVEPDASGYLLVSPSSPPSYGWQTGSVLSPGYVRQSEDRLSEPRSPRRDHRRNHLVRSPRRAGLQDSRPGWKRVGPVNARGLKSHLGRTDFPEFLPIGAKAAPFNPISR